MKYETVINGLPVSASFSDKFIEETVKSLLKQWEQMYLEKGQRIIVYLAAPPGAGKSTMVELFEKLSKEVIVEPMIAIGMDGFHHYQDYLLANSVERNGQIINMVDIKGAPITFDLEALKARISRLKTEEVVPWPIYDRPSHNPKDNAIMVKEKIVLIEGNYLLLDEPGWRDLKEMADQTIYIKADEETLRTRLIDRKLKTCPDEEKAIHFVEFSDMENARLCLAHSMEADVVIELQDVLG